MQRHNGNDLTAERLAERECPACGLAGQMEMREIEMPVTEGTATVLVKLTAAVCSVCGEVLLDLDNAARLDAVAERLRAGDTSGMLPVGTVYRLPAA